MGEAAVPTDRLVEERVVEVRFGAPSRIRAVLEAHGWPAGPLLRREEDADELAADLLGARRLLSADTTPLGVHGVRVVLEAEGADAVDPFVGLDDVVTVPVAEALGSPRSTSSG